MANRIASAASPGADIAKDPPSLRTLFFAFAKMSLSGFGGVLVFARRAIVDEHRWMTAEEFNETFALCHFLPGPNIVNLAMVFGARLRGVAGGDGECRDDDEAGGRRGPWRPGWRYRRS